MGATTPFAYTPGDSFLAGLQKAIAQQETGPFDKGDGNVYKIRNKAGAAGRYQFKDDTWAGVFTGKKLPTTQAQNASADTQDRAFCTLMDRYRQKFGDNVELLAVAWHAGPGSAAKVQNKTKTASDFKDSAGASTATYAYNVARYYLAATGQSVAPATPSAKIAGEKLRTGSTGTIAIPTVDEGASLLGVEAFGMSHLVEAWTSGSVDLSTSMVSEVQLGFHDPRLAVGSKMSITNPIDWGQWGLEVAAIETSAGPSGTGATSLVCRSRLAQTLKRTRPKTLSYPNRSVSDVLRQVLGSTGKTHTIQDTPTQSQVVINTDEATGQPEFWWDALMRWSQDPAMTGGPDFLCFEAAGIVYFGSPTWLVTRTPTLLVAAAFTDQGVELDDGLGELPSVRQTGDDPDAPVVVTLQVRPELGARIMPGMSIDLQSPPAPGLYLVQSVRGSLDAVGNWTIQAVLPVDTFAKATTSDEFDSTATSGVGGSEAIGSDSTAANGGAGSQGSSAAFQSGSTKTKRSTNVTGKFTADSPLVDQIVPARSGLTGGKLSKPTMIVLHATTGSESQEGASNSAHWFQSPKAGGSAHYTVGPEKIIQSVPESTIAYGAKGSNSFGIHIEHAGSADQSAAQWRDKNSAAIIRNSAQLMAEISKRHGIPLVFLTAQDLKAGRRSGVTMHSTISEWARLTGLQTSQHYDPGPGFPLHELIALATKARG